MITLTESGLKKYKDYIQEATTVREKAIAVGYDTADETNLPTIADIISDINCWGDEDGYYNGWGVTDNHISLPICLIRNEDYVVD
jgi:hypothetical protein